MHKKDIGAYHLFFKEGQDPEAEFVAQYNCVSRVISNFWGTISIELSPNANVMEVAEKLEAFEASIQGSLA